MHLIKSEERKFLEKYKQRSKLFFRLDKKIKEKIMKKFQINLSHDFSLGNILYKGMFLTRENLLVLSLYHLLDLYPLEQTEESFSNLKIFVFKDEESFEKKEVLKEIIFLYRNSFHYNDNNKTYKMFEVYFHELTHSLYNSLYGAPNSLEEIFMDEFIAYSLTIDFFGKVRRYRAKDVIKELNRVKSKDSSLASLAYFVANYYVNRKNVEPKHKIKIEEFVRKFFDYYEIAFYLVDKIKQYDFSLEEDLSVVYLHLLKIIKDI